MKASKASKIIGAVAGVVIVLLIIITVTWLVINNGTKPFTGEPNGNETHETTTILPSTKANTVGDVNDATNTPPKSPKIDQSKNSTTFLIYSHCQSIWTRPYFSKNTPLSKINITDSPAFSSKFTEDVYIEKFTSDCSNKRIYILKKLISTDQHPKQVLDVIEYDDNNKFQRIQQVSDMFNNATSIASDRTTGKIYWIEESKSDIFAIKVTNKFFNESNFVNQPTKGFMKDIQVYPKQNKIFFLKSADIWYTSNTPNSTASLFFPKTQCHDIVIDYALDKLCCSFISNLICVGIGTGQSQKEEIYSKYTGFVESFAVFYNRFYLIKRTDYPYLYMKNGYDTPEFVASNVTGKNSLSPLVAGTLFLFSQECIV